MEINGLPLFYSKIRKSLTILLQLIIWTIILLMIYSQIKYNEIEFVYIAFYVFSLFCFFMLELFSNTAFYLKNIIADSEDVHSFIQKLFITPLKIKFKIECYHYSYTTNSKNRQEKRKIISHKATSEFKFNYWKDISGLFVLDRSNCFSREQREQIQFIKLNLDIEYIFHDNETRQNYENQKQAFIFQHENRDIHMDFNENVEIEGFKSHSLVKITKSEIPPYIGYKWFLLFTLVIPCAEIYKLYVKKMCFVQHFIIKKTLSSSININEVRNSPLLSINNIDNRFDQNKNFGKPKSNDYPFDYDLNNSNNGLITNENNFEKNEYPSLDELQNENNSKKLE